MSALGILGPLRLGGPAGDVRLGGDRPRRLLAILAVHANEVVSVDRLTEAVWSSAAPRSARENLQTYVWSLRRAIKASGARGIQIAAEPPGYVLRIEPAELDWLLFTELAGAAEECAARDPARAGELLREALGQWRGEVLADVGEDLPVLRPRLTAMAEARLSAIELRIRADLDCGRSRESAAELSELVVEHPLRERMRALQMLALHRSGRQADALAVFHQLRAQLAEELGVDPGPEVREVYQAILRADPAIDGPARASARVPRQLPARPAGFCGRDSELDRLATMPDAVVVLAGPPGVGKTALALCWAHSVQDRFPDGTFFADLHGYDPDNPPSEPGDVIDGFLRALGTPPRAIPPSLTQRSAMFRSLLDGRCALLILDNAVSAAQVRPLLPGSGGSRVLVTSRSRLNGLAVHEGAARITVGPLSDADGLTLLQHAVGDLVTLERTDAVEVSRLCAGLPLALRIAADRVAARPGLGLRGVAEELADERGRLSVLETGDHDVAVRAAFGSSYGTLGAAAATMFRLSAVHPAREFSVPAAAAALAVPDQEAARLLSELADTHLVEWPVPGRARVHDLLAVYAAEQTDSAERIVALRRLLCWYLHTADAADSVLIPRRARPPLRRRPDDCRPLSFADYNQAFAWCEAERENLVAATRRALTAGELAFAWQLPAAISGYLKVSRRWSDWIGTHGCGLEGARRLGDREAQAWLLSSLGAAYGDLRRFDDAEECLLRALELRHATGDVAGEAATRLNLGVLSWRRERFDDGIGHFRQSLSLSVAAGDGYAEAMAHNNLGEAYQQLGRLPEALDHLRQALAVFQANGDLYNQAMTLDGLGICELDLGNLDEAVSVLEQSVALRRQAADRQGEAATLEHLGKAFLARGDRERAHGYWRQALAIYTELGDPEADRIRGRLDADL